MEGIAFMNKISSMIANYPARPLGYKMTEGWEQADKATTEYFRPIGTFGARFDEYLRDVRATGFEAIDMWTGVLGGLDFVTQAHVQTAQELLRKHGLAVYSFGGWLGSTREYFTRVCELAVAFGAPVLGGGTTLLAEDRDFLVDTLKVHGLRLGIENHPHPDPEKPEEILEMIGDGGGGTLGTTVDTGWYGAQGVDAAEAIERLGPYIYLVSLKDVREMGQHDTCRYGEGVVPIERCVRMLKKIGYTGTISVEHVVGHFDPTEDVVASLRMLKGWIREVAA
jgi:sugar phosphate isomerase/epimerase